MSTTRLLRRAVPALAHELKPKSRRLSKVASYMAGLGWPAVRLSWLAIERWTISVTTGMIGYLQADVSQGCRLEIYKRRGFKGGHRLLGVGAHRSLPPDWDDETSSAKCMCKQVGFDGDSGDQPNRDGDGYDDNRGSAGLGSGDAKACLLFSGRQGAGRRYRIEAGNKLDDIASRVRSLEIPNGCVLSGYPRENQPRRSDDVFFWPA